MIVRLCTEEDLPSLGIAFPLGANEHERRLQGQNEGQWLYLLALETSPVGSCVVRWDGPLIARVRERLPEAVDISNLHVAVTARGRGVGRALVAEAELQAAHRHRKVIGLGVADDNPDARRLYERLGYTASGVRYCVEYDYLGNGEQVVRTTEAGDFLVKALPTKSGVCARG